jgi:hypothetical protein
MRIFERVSDRPHGKRSANIKWRRSKFTGVFGMQMHIDDRLGIGL